MIFRTISAQVLELKRYFPILYIGGPRQSGKTTLICTLFTEMPYRNLEDPDTLAYALSDPRGFLAGFSEGGIIDEAQRAPELFSYLQNIVDTHPNKQFILSGSQNFLLLERITQSLAGRVGILTLLPFGARELAAHQPLPNVLTYAWQGSYPPLYDRTIPPRFFFRNYVTTYLERDVRQLVQIGDLNRFNRFLQLCAGRAGQVLNLSSLAQDADIAVNTAKSWLSVLEASYLVFQLPPYFKNFNKRLIKSPKLYFTDTGLMCHLLGVNSPDQLDIHFAYGAIVENLFISEYYKRYTNAGERPPFYYWRDSNGHEVDLLIDEGGELRSVEIKASRTYKSTHFKGLRWWQKTTELPSAQSTVLYLGDQSFETSEGTLLGWADWIAGRAPRHR